MIFTKRTSGIFRAAILLAAIFAMLGVSVASTSAAHFHEGSNGGRCDICVTAHVVSVEARAVFQFVGATRVYESLATGAPVIGYQILLTRSSFSRGPPSPVA